MAEYELNPKVHACGQEAKEMMLLLTAGTIKSVPIDEIPINERPSGWSQPKYVNQRPSSKDEGLEIGLKAGAADTVCA